MRFVKRQSELFANQSPLSEVMNIALAQKSKELYYMIAGALFGLFFPMLSWLLDVYIKHELALSLDSVVFIHKENVLHFVIDTAPIFLALAFGVAGRKQDELIELNRQLDATISHKTQEVYERNHSLTESHGRLSQNIEELKATQEQLALQKQIAEKYSLLQQAILNYAPSMIISTELDGTITSFNRTCEYLLGYQAKNIVGKNSPLMFHELSELLGYAPVLSQELGEPISVGIEMFIVKAKKGLPNIKRWTFVKKNGQRFPVELTVSSLKNPGQEAIGYLWVATDVSEQQEAQEQIDEYLRVLEKNYEENLVTLDLVKKQKNEIQSKNTAIMSSISYAQRIQEALLPNIVQVSRHLPENFFLLKPKDVVSGDFYYFAEKEEKIILAAVDCTGHGVPGAFMSLIGKNLLDQIIHDKEIHRPDLILDELHKNIRQVLKQDEKQTSDGMDIALVCIDKKLQTLEFAGAKNPLLYLQNQKMHVIKGDRISIGSEETINFTLHTIDVAASETTFYLITDGLQDQFGGTQNKKFGMKQLQQLLLEYHQEPCSNQAQMLEGVMDIWRLSANEKQTDDMLIVGAKIQRRS